MILFTARKLCDLCAFIVCWCTVDWRVETRPPMTLIITLTLVDEHVHRLPPKQGTVLCLSFLPVFLT